MQFVNNPLKEKLKEGVHKDFKRMEAEGLIRKNGTNKNGETLWTATKKGRKAYEEIIRRKNENSDG